MWPGPEHLQKALGTAFDFYVNTDLFLSDSSKMADLVLPAASTFERDVVVNGRGGMFFPVGAGNSAAGRRKNDVEIMIGMLNAMHLTDEALGQGL